MFKWSGKNWTNEWWAHSTYIWVMDDSNDEFIDRSQIRHTIHLRDTRRKYFGFLIFFNLSAANNSEGPPDVLI